MQASISVSSDDSDDSGPNMDASNDLAATDNEDTETDTDNPMDATQPPAKRRRGKPLQLWSVVDVLTMAMLPRCVPALS